MTSELSLLAKELRRHISTKFANKAFIFTKHASKSQAADPLKEAPATAMPPIQKVRELKPTKPVRKKLTPSSRSSQKPPPKPVATATPPSKEIEFDLSGIQATFKELFPQIPIKEPLSDDPAKAVLSSWKQGAAEVLLLLGPCSDEEEEFMKNVGRAVHIHLKKTRLLKSENWSQEEALRSYKAVISSRSTIQNTFSLTSLYKEDHGTLNQSPIVFMEEPSYYFTHPEEKARLWETLCQTLTL